MILKNWANSHFQVQNDVAINHYRGQTHLSEDQLFPDVIYILQSHMFCYRKESDFLSILANASFFSLIWGSINLLCITQNLNVLTDPLPGI